MMAASVKYITYEYKTLLHNAAIVLSIVMLAVIGVNSVLAFMAPNWPIRLISFAGILFGVSSCWLLYTSISHFIAHRDQMVMVKWIVSYMCLFVGMLPITLFVYLNLDWHLFATYGKMAFDIYLSLENMVLPIALMLLVSSIYWTLTIQLYKISYTTYLCINKKEEIYGK